jgi:glutamyl-tRNA synthetase
MEWDVLWSINKRIIDPIVPRHFAISNLNKYVSFAVCLFGMVVPNQFCSPLFPCRVSAIIKGGQDVAWVESLPTHKKNPEVGSKKVTFSPTIYFAQSDASSFDADEEVNVLQKLN